MTKWCWSLALVAVLGAGTARTVYWKCASRSPTCCINNGQPVPAPGFPSDSQTQAPLAKPSAPAPGPGILDDVDEPIITRPEPLDETPPVNTTEPAPTTGGAKESDVAATLAPRLDRDLRRMPYADDVAPSKATSMVIWLAPPGPVIVLPSGFILEMPLARLAITPPDAVEESEEPPILEDALPPYYHPPHCPYGGQCPYPSIPYRMKSPR
jgi:hypothetical protein